MYYNVLLTIIHIKCCQCVYFTLCPLIRSYKHVNIFFLLTQKHRVTDASVSLVSVTTEVNAVEEL